MESGVRDSCYSGARASGRSRGSRAGGRLDLPLVKNSEAQ